MVMSGSFQKTTVVIIDGMDFRRARVESFLHNWAAEEKVELVSAAPEDAHAKLARDADVGLMIYNAGRVPSSSSEVLAEIHVLRALRPSAALVIVTDDGSLDDVTSAINAGAQGYFNNSMRPDLVLQALSFVLHGGTYFPPTALSGHPSGAALPHHGCGGNGRLPIAGPPSQPDEKPESSSSSGQQQHAEIPAAEPVSCVQRSDHGSAEGHVPVPSRQAPPLVNGTHVNGTHAGVIHANGAKVVEHQMTDRQQSVLQCLCLGDPNKVVARKLGMTETTVKVHVREIMRKLGVANRTQIAIAAGSMGPFQLAGLLPKKDTNGAEPSGTPH
jgi:DNA-binding NarL/FixJ family response regulator